MSIGLELGNPQTKPQSNSKKSEINLAALLLSSSVSSVIFSCPLILPFIPFIPSCFVYGLSPSSNGGTSMNAFCLYVLALVDLSESKKDEFNTNLACLGGPENF